MKKFFKYLFILTIMFILPNFVLADETDTTFDHIDINKSVSLKYTVSGNEKIYTKTLDSLADVKLYIVDKDNSNVRTPIDLSGATATDGTYRINGNFNKLYEGTDTFVKYLVEYTFNDQDIYTNLNSNTNKSITYSKEYSFNSEHNKSTDGGILIDLQETNSIQNISPMLTIRKQLAQDTPPGTFKFNIKNANGTVIRTVTITIPQGSNSADVAFEDINLNATYRVEEADIQNIYKLDSITSNKEDPTIVPGSNETTVRATSTSDSILVTAINSSVVDHSKTVSDNHDGTYELELSVKGDAKTDIQPASNVNVLIIYDVSSSMTNNVTGTNYSRADYAEDVVHDFVDALATHQNPNDRRNIEVAVVTFGPTASGRQSWTTDLTSGNNGVNRFFDDGVDGRVTSSHNYNRNNGTNWEAALQQAQTYLRSADTDPTFVILVTDGACTASGNGNNAINPAGNRPWTDFRPFYNAATDEARAIGTRDDTTLFGIYAYGREADLLDDLIYYSKNGTDRPGMNGETVTDTPNYYNASNTSALTSAIEDIFNQIIETLGVNSVVIKDGTTSSVQTSSGDISHLLTVDESYKYWLEIPTVNNQFTRINQVTGETVVYTVTDNNNGTLTIRWAGNEVTVKGKRVLGGIRYQWEEANALYNVAPPAAHLNGSSVDWDLTSAGTLLDGVKYSVTFNVWPSQYTYDLISDFDNGIKDYNSSEFNDIRPYLIKNSNGSYSLLTNTTATLEYDDSRDDDDPRVIGYVNPDPVATGVSEVTLVKEWENDLDSREADEIELFLVMDDEDYGPTDEGGKILPYVLRKTDDPKTNWTTQVFISTGLISLDRTTGTAIVREVGHEYGFREKPSDAYYWDLEVTIRRPMVINKANGELETVMLIKLTDEEKSKLTTADINTLDTKNYLVKDSIEYFRICYRDENGNDIPDSCNIYRRATTDESNTISAKNYRRSNLNVTKAVDGDYDPDTLFTFNLQVTDKNGHDVWFSIWDKENNGYIINVPGTNYVTGATTDDIVTAEVLTASDSIKNIVYDPTTGKVTYTEDGVNKDYIIIGENPNGTPYTGFFYFNSGNTVTVLMKAGWNLRFTNLPNGSTYTFVENLSSAYSLEKVELNKYRKKDGAATPDINEDITLPKSTRVTGEIDEHNLSYTVIYTNKAVKTDNPVTARKIWEDNNNSYGKRPTSLKLNLLADGKLKETVIVNGPNWNYTWNNLAKYNAAGEEIVYTVTETAVNEGDLAYYIPVLNGLTITNYINLTNITVNKDWGTVPQEKRVSIVVGIKSQHDDGKTYQNQTSLTSGNGWSATFNNVPKYIVIEGVPVIVDGAPVLVNYLVDEMSIEGTTLENGVFIEKDTRINAIIGKYTYVVEKTTNGYVIRNTYKAMPTKTLYFIKRKNNSEGPVLEGATFALYRFIGEGESGLERELNIQNLPENWILIGTATSNSEGKFSFSNLYIGEYRLIETIAPANCVLPKGQWIIFLDYKDDTEEEVVIRNNTILSTDKSQSGAIIIKDDGRTIEVINKEIPNIPTTGGIGIPHYNKYGLLLMLLSIGIWLFNILNQRKQIENI